MNVTPPRWRRWLIRAGLAYGLVVLALYVFQDKFLYNPAGPQVWSASAAASTREMFVTARDGNSIHMRFYPVDGSQKAVLYAHGNAGNLCHRDELCLTLARKLRLPVVIFDYPGYGKSTGQPSEPGCYAAADAAWDWLTRVQGVPPEEVVLFGKSLGGAMAIDLASRHPHRALVLVQAFTTMPDVAAEKMPLIPARWLTRPSFDNLSKICACRAPIFIEHGRLDSLIHCSHAECLRAAASGPVEVMIDERGRHGAIPFEFYDRLKAFLDRHASD